MTRTLLERCLTKWLEDADPAECVDLVEAIRAELAKPQGEPVAWIFDWYAEPDDGGDGLIRDWLTTSYDEAHSPTMGCENIRPLYLRNES